MLVIRIFVVSLQRNVGGGAILARRKKAIATP